MNAVGCIQAGTAAGRVIGATEALYGVFRAFEADSLGAIEMRYPRIKKAILLPANGNCFWAVALHDNGGLNDPAMLAVKAIKEEIPVDRLQEVLMHQPTGAVNSRKRLIFCCGNRLHVGYSVPEAIHQRFEEFSCPLPKDALPNLFRIMKATLDTWQPEILV